MKYSTDLTDVSVNTESLIKNILGNPMELDEFCKIVAEFTGDELDEIENRLEGCHFGAELIDVLGDMVPNMTSSEPDNACNSENDLDSVFTYGVFDLSGGSVDEWYYGDNEHSFIVINIHRGGDPRGNYHGYEVYRLCDTPSEHELCSFFDWSVGFSVVNRKGERVEDTDEFSAGYHSSPMHHISSCDDFTRNEWEVLGRWTNDGFQCRYKGETVFLVPDEWTFEVNQPTPRPNRYKAYQ